ncbi:MAG: hypothetical protein ACYTBS_09595 [Planctomycetota bacterium]|jgi:hypothetical protein
MNVDRKIAGGGYGPIRVSGVEYKTPVGKQIELTDDRSGVTKTPLLDERACAGEMINKAFSTPQEAFRFRSSAAPTTIVPRERLSGGTARLAGDQTPQFASVPEDILKSRPGPGFISIDIDVKIKEEDHV